MRIADVLVAPIVGGFFHDDLAAVRRGAVRDGQAYAGAPLTPGFDAVRVPARGLGIGLRLEDGTIAWGDAVTVQYSGAGGREAPLEPDERIAGRLRQELTGLAAGGFRRSLPAVLAAASGSVALRYGLSQAWAAAVAAAQRRTLCEVLCDEYGLPLPAGPVPVYAQSGDHRHDNADKMIMKRVDALPHGLINNLDTFGAGGETLIEYVEWLVTRIVRLADAGYRPTLHLDLYGTAGLAFGGDVEAVADYLARLEKVAVGHPLRIESPLDLGSRAAQIDGFAALREALRRRDSAVALVVDEWCNTLDDVRAFVAAGACDAIQIKMPDLGSIEDSVLAVLECKRAGVGTVLGGSCAETEVSARVSVHVALATGPDVQLAKPGMGVDEGVMLVRNEQTRVLTALGVG
ncbi:methylaspartate ammonia-lyase [Micromonospora tulbaghiae]|uniref:methylaspartate ammonia-lyase n=1 Tax=Micromonospora tulbaghiae TaxID=479978 RepID=A0A386WUS4_9ACTN|nr:methylaspartate ammonia-lyase [Micromonospora tulbaghiae]AYF31961.1 methylaspartate ammonia-lyase [Micromonospora tulbaghiae]